ncbi:hypothetical protein ASN18_2293 [Candidatus Magnetominusculus xianensis]|uniref:DUF4390 domain-containing protein n=2 Tax=Candidatus Magnetominusculus xianensis TaxID=1748249 RepID=A0ABR5SHM1_9BACT|nr:hypothetical protein ASN18_2293 [Candidatus Magnetominusculus xianensis]
MLKMNKLQALILLIIMLFLPALNSAQEIAGVEHAVSGSNMTVSVTLSIDESQISLIREGLQKEFVFYIDIFRRWSLWPDEFVRGKRISRTIQANSVKGEYKVISSDETAVLEKRFMSFKSMLKWALMVNDVKIDMSGLEDDAPYFIRVTVESIKKKPPQVLGYVFFFVDDKDFKIKKDTDVIIKGSK